jgi:phosphomannomutase/phosphoglucomutase
MKTIFREYDIRGIYPSQLNEKSIKLLGYFLSKKITGEYVSIGYDARNHSFELFEYLVSGLRFGGKKVIHLGMVATGVNYFSAYQEFNNITPSATIMITGSHNPSQYNGFKISIDKKPFFGQDIYDLGDQIIQNSNLKIPNDVEYENWDIKSIYINWMVDKFSNLKDFKPKIAIDCGNGVASTVLTDIFDKLNINYKGLYLQPDGDFPNHHPDPSIEENLIDLKKELKDDINLGFAYDGDADRIAVLTQKNNIKGDILALLFAKTMENPVIIGEVKCSQIMYDEIDKIGKSIMYKTGHSNLKVKILETQAHLAAEVSGHIFFNDRYFGFDDAIYATFRVMELIQENIDLDLEIEKLPKLFSTEEIKIETTEEKKFQIIDELKIKLQNIDENFPKIKDIIDVDGVRVIFEDGWGLVRASNTTPVLVTRFEAKSEELCNFYQKKLTELLDNTNNDIESLTCE